MLVGEFRKRLIEILENIDESLGNIFMMLGSIDENIELIIDHDIEAVRLYMVSEEEANEKRIFAERVREAIKETREKIEKEREPEEI